MRRGMLYSKSIFWQLVVFSLLISLMPILIISGFLFQRMQKMVRTELETSHAQLVSQYEQNVQKKLDQYRASLDYISDNTVILDILAGGQESNAYSRGKIISEEVSKSLLLDRQSEIRNCMVYSELEDIPAYGSRVSMMSQASREVWYMTERVEAEGSFAYFVLKDDTDAILSFVNLINQLDTENLTRSRLGIVKLDVYMKQLFAPAASEDGESASYDILVYGEGSEPQIYYSTSADLNENLTAWLEEKAGGQADPESAFVMEEADFADYGLHVLFLFDNSELVLKTRELTALVFPLFLAVGLAAAALAWLYSRKFSARIAALVARFKRAETGDLTPAEPVGGTDEIAVLNRQFDHMLIKLQELIQTNYIQQLQNKETQLRNLQLQINPHFLYNTLETISSLAAVSNAFVVSDMCQKLGDIFRYSLGKNQGESVTLQQELEHTKNYIFIQQIRYGSRFQIFYSIDAEPEQYRILRFILQPIVENSILHGMGDLTRTVTIEISAVERDGALLLRVSDDGVGMPEEKARELGEYISSENPLGHAGEKSIGMRNVHQRIRLSCGEGYGVRLDSHPGRGCCVTLRLPVRHVGEEGEINSCGNSPK